MAYREDVAQTARQGCRVAAALHQGVFDREEGTFALHKPLLKSSRRLHTAKTVLPDASMK